MDEGRAGDPLEDVVRLRRGDEGAVAHDEDVLGAALGHVPVVGQHDRLVEAVLHRLGLGESAVHVDAGALRARRGDVVVDATPRGHHAADAVVDVDVGAEGRGDDEEAVLQPVQADADLLRGLVEEGPDVDVLAPAVAAEQLGGDGAELLGAQRELHEQDLRALPQTVVVLGHPQREELLLLLDPVGADPLEAAGAVVEGVGQDPQPRVRVAADLPVEVDPALVPGGDAVGHCGCALGHVGLRLGTWARRARVTQGTGETAVALPLRRICVARRCWGRF